MAFRLWAGCGGGEIWLAGETLLRGGMLPWCVGSKGLGVVPMLIEVCGECRCCFLVREDDCVLGVVELCVVRPVVAACYDGRGVYDAVLVMVELLPTVGSHWDSELVDSGWDRDDR